MPGNGAYMWQHPKLHPVTAKAVGPEAASRPSPGPVRQCFESDPFLFSTRSLMEAVVIISVLGSRETLSSLSKEEEPPKSTPLCHF